MRIHQPILALSAGFIVLAGLAAAAILPRLAAPTTPHIGGPFSLIDGDGHPVTDQDFRGKFLLVYFGYTHCPDVCPTTLSDLAAGIAKLAPADQKKVRVLFITVDPARDTPAIMGQYASAFGPDFIGLTGNAAALAPVEASYHVYAQRHDLKDGDYAMDHSSVIYLMNPGGTFDGLLDGSLKPGEIAAKLRDAGV